MPDPRDESRYGTGHDDGLEPLAPLDPSQVGSVDELVRAMSRTAFGGRSGRLRMCWRPWSGTPTASAWSRCRAP